MAFITADTKSKRRLCQNAGNLIPAYSAVTIAEFVCVFHVIVLISAEVWFSTECSCVDDFRDSMFVYCDLYLRYPIKSTCTPILYNRIKWYYKEAFNFNFPTTFMYSLKVFDTHHNFIFNYS